MSQPYRPEPPQAFFQAYADAATRGSAAEGYGRMAQTFNEFLRQHTEAAGIHFAGTFAKTDHLLKAEIPAAMLLLNDILSRGFQGQLFVNGLAAHFRDLLVAKDEATLPLLEVAQSVRERYRTQAAQVPTRFLYRALKICRQCDQNAIPAATMT